MDGRKQIQFFIGIQLVVVLYIRSGGADNAGQRGAQIMGDCAQKVCSDPLFFCFIQLPFPFCKYFVLTGKLRGHGAGGHGDNQHADEGKGVSAHGKINLKERISEAYINEDYAEQGRKDAVQVSGGPSGNQDQGEDVDKCNVGCVILY